MDKRLFHDITYGMYVLTTHNNNQKIGCIVNTFVQITSGDMIVAVSVNKQNYTNQAIKNTKKFAISIISEQTKKEVIGTFGFRSSKDTDKFANFDHEIIDGLPVIKEHCTGYLICDLVNIVDCGTHDIILGKVIDSQKFNNNTPMTYSYYHNVIKGTAPKNAPTFQQQEQPKTTEGKKYKCLLCGYIHDEAKESVQFSELPDDWKCPLCGAEKSLFIEI